jgi:mannose-6-phosphate isomerase-like protein (cupin superfamily)
MSSRPPRFHSIESLLPEGLPLPRKADVATGDTLFLGLNVLQPGEIQALHTHQGQDKAYVVLRGEGDFTVEDETRRCGAGTTVWAPSMEVHGVSNPGPEPLVMLVVMAPPPPSRSTG